MQLGKCARQALAEGIRDKTEICVTPDSELYKQLDEHYNPDNTIHSPEHLCTVLQTTLRELFALIQQGKDSERMWMGGIYRMTHQLDAAVPDYFKDPEFMERLEKAPNGRLHCTDCNESLQNTHFVQCPRVKHHRFCFPCSKKSLLKQYGGAYCPSGMKCSEESSPGVAVPWAFKPHEIESILSGGELGKETRSEFA